MTDIKHDVFRFVAIRPPATPEGDEPPVVLRDGRELGETFVGKVADQLGQARTHGRLLSALKRAAEAAGVGPDVPATQAGHAVLRVAAVVRRGIEEETVEGLAEAVDQALGMAVKDFVGRDDYAALVEDLWDRLETHYLLNRLGGARNLERLVAALRATRLLGRLAEGAGVVEAEELSDVAGTTLVLPSSDEYVEPPTPQVGRRAAAQAERDEEATSRYRELWHELVDVHQALGLVQEAPSVPVDAVVQRGVEAEPRRSSTTGRETGLEDTTTASRTATVPGRVLDGLPERARKVVDTVPRTGDLNDKPRLVAALEHRLAALSQQVLTSQDPLLIRAMPAEAAQLPGMQVYSSAFESATHLEVEWDATPVQFPWVSRPIIRPLGIGDLKVVKETLQRYVAGEVAHIENVLDGEKKERTHRRLDRTEETFTIENETTEEIEKDNQTTDRFELKKETEKTIQTDLSVDAGVTVSASYGPVELGAYANFAYSQSSSDTTRTSQNFARDVVDRSLTKIQKRTREERVTKTLKEIEETNLHGIDNSPAGNGHVTGIYRWVDKEYQAQVHNYGKRMMFEFVVPEPAAYYYYAQENDPSNKIQVDRPRTLGLLTHQDVQAWNFGEYVRAYNVQGVTPPPPAWKVVSATFDQNGMTDDQATSKSSKELIVPDGYLAKSFGYRWSVWHLDTWHFDVLVGLEAISSTSTNLSNEDTVVPISIISRDITAYAVNVEVFCERTARAFELWQIATFEKIVNAYEQAMAMYNDKLKAAEVARGIVIEGRNPGINAMLIRNELKRQCITHFTGNDLSQFNAVTGTPPVVDLVESEQEGTFIQFFEQAFEWEQLTYLFYPYFWARQSTWNQRLAFNDNDPLFNQFLQSGSARVVVPVHPAYNDAVLHFVETGELWDGGTPPHLDDPLFLSIVEELKAATDDLDGAVPEGDPWQVTVPTTLVYLQADASLPDFTV